MLNRSTKIESLVNEWLCHDPLGRSPLDRLPLAEWVDAFRAVGFFRHDEQFPIDASGLRSRETSLALEGSPGRTTVTMFRCATPNRERGMSWAGSAEYASRYGDGTWGYHSTDPQLFWAEVPSTSILAIFSGNTSTGAEIVEYVIDPRTIEIHADRSLLNTKGI